MMQRFDDSDLLLIKEFVNSLSRKSGARQESYDPYKPLTREEIFEQLAIAKKHADEGRVMPAHQASRNISEKHGL